MAKRLQQNASVSDSRRIPILKEYTTPRRVSEVTNDDDEKRATTVELRYLRDRIKQQNDKIRRLKEEILDELQMLTAALDENKQETFDQVKRRISRLRGALEYQGRSDYTLTER